MHSKHQQRRKELQENLKQHKCQQPIKPRKYPFSQSARKQLLQVMKAIYNFATFLTAKYYYQFYQDVQCFNLRF